MSIGTTRTLTNVMPFIQLIIMSPLQGCHLVYRSILE